MTSFRNFSNLSRLYPIQKTLKFKLEPKFETRDNITKMGLLKEDFNRAQSYGKMKKTIDEYHKYFIYESLKNASLSKLVDYYNLYIQNKGVRDEKEFDKVKRELREEIAKWFEKDSLFKKLFKKELIKEDLKAWIKNKGRNDYFDADFEKFTTYFSGFHESRKNIYKGDGKHTSIAFRLIDENLPKFLDNMKIYENIKKNNPLLTFGTISTDMGNELQGSTLDDFFKLDFFNQLMTQVGIDRMNIIIGGKNTNNGKKLKGINEYINEYNQLNPKKTEIPQLKKLYKQILSDRTSTSMHIPFENDSDLLESIFKYYQNDLRCFKISENSDEIDILSSIKSLLFDISNYDITKVFLKNGEISKISNVIFGSYRIIEDAISYYYENIIDINFKSDYDNAKSDNKRKQIIKKKDSFLKQDYISIGVLQKSLDVYINCLDESHEIRKSYNTTILCNYFKEHFKAENYNETKSDMIEDIKSKYSLIEELLNVKKINSRPIQNSKNVDKIKSFLDSIKKLYWFIKPLKVDEGIILEKDMIFYNQFDSLYTQLDILTKLYSKIQSYVEKKPYSEEKIKLNFKNSTLMDGWDISKETSNYCSLFIKDELYYLGIMDKSDTSIFNNFRESAVPNKDGCYQKIEYRLLKDAAMDLPHIFFSEKGKENYKPSKHIINIYKQKTYAKGNNFNINSCHEIIDFYKDSIKNNKNYNIFDFKFSPTNSFKDIDGFFEEVNRQGYKIKFINIPENLIHKKIKNGEMHFFQIYNMDFSKSSHGNPNKHTLIWKALFDDKNLSDVVYKLNGHGEIFFREASIEKENIIVHKAGQEILSKNPLTPGKKNIYSYDIIKDRRYTDEQFEFHVSVTANFISEKTKNINDKVYEYLRNNKEMHIIGIDRGVNNLIYIMLMDLKGNILLQKSLNIIEDKDHNVETNYQLLISKRVSDKIEAQKSWNTINSIKELKNGYISQVVYQIAKLAVDWNAIIVMENLNRSKRGMFGIEKTVYQKFEKQLIEYLNYLVFKNERDSQPGSIYHALQLTNKFKTFEDIGKQTGIIFYVEPHLTSKIDPTTGFVDLLHPYYTSIKESKDFFSKFDSISYNEKEDWFEFEFDYNNFTTPNKGSQTKWTICTTPDTRYVWNRSLNVGKGGYKEYDITKELKSLFDKSNISYINSNDIKTQIINQNQSEFFKSLIYFLSVAITLRQNNGIDDFILSPVKNKMDYFFNSQKVKGNENPKDSDANGSYHIAIKGIQILERINKSNPGDKIDLSTKTKEYLEFTQQHAPEFIQQRNNK